MFLACLKQSGRAESVCSREMQLHCPLLFRAPCDGRTHPASVVFSDSVSGLRSSYLCSNTSFRSVVTGVSDLQWFLALEGWQDVLLNSKIGASDTCNCTGCCIVHKWWRNLAQQKQHLFPWIFDSKLAPLSPSLLHLVVPLTNLLLVRNT